MSLDIDQVWQNVLVFQVSPKWWVKLSDFGISKRLHEHTAFRTTVGTLAYMASEIRGIYALLDDDSGNNEERTYTFAVDMWSLGQLTSQMITGQLLFQDARQLNGYVARGNPFPLTDLECHDASDLCCDFIENVMCRLPSRRMTAEQALKHSWIMAKGNHLTNQDPISGIDKKIETTLAISSVASAAYSTITPHDRELYQTPVVLPQANHQYRFRQTQHFKTHQGAIEFIAFAPDSLQFVSVSVFRVETSDGETSHPYTVELWGANSQGQFERVQKLEHDGNRVRSIAFSPNGRWIFGGGDLAGQIFLWKAVRRRRFNPIPEYLFFHSCANSITFAPDGQRFATCYFGSIMILELDRPLHISGSQRLQCIDVSGFTSLAFSPNGQLLASGTRRGSICIWRVSDQGKFQEHQKISCGDFSAPCGDYSVRSVRFSSGGQRLICGFSDIIRRFQLNLEGEFEQIQQLEGHTDTITSVFCLPNSQGLVSVSLDGTIRVWEADHHGRLEQVQKIEGFKWILDLSPDGDWLVALNMQTQDDYDYTIWKLQAV